MDLTDLEKDVLGFEHLRWKHAGTKENAIRERFGLTSTRYYQVLHGLLSRPEALQHDPRTVLRLRRVREQRPLRRRA